MLSPFLLLAVSVDVQLPACRPAWLEPEPFAALLAVETSSGSFDQLALTIPDCERAPETMELTVTSTVGSARRTISLRDVPTSVRLRALAIAAGELEIQPPPPPPGPPRIPASQAAPSPVVITSEVEDFDLRPEGAAAIGVRHYGATDTTALTVQGGLSHPFFLAPPFGFEAGAELRFAAASRSLPQGDAGLMLFSVRPHLDVVYEVGPLRIAVGPGLELGYGLVRGTAASSEVSDRSAGAPVVLADLTLSGRVAVTERFGARLWLEAGLPLIGLEGALDDKPVIGWSGPFAGGGAGLVLSF